MTKLQRNFIIKLGFFLILLIITFLPYGDNTVKGFGRIIIFTSISSDAIQNVLSKGNKKDNVILVITYVIFFLTMISPIHSVNFGGGFLFSVVIFKEDIKTYFKRLKKDKSGCK
jgi:hypothetical protein